MAIAFVSQGSVIGTAGATTVTVPYPGSLVANNAFILVVMNCNPGAFTTPSGWGVVQANGSVGGDLGFGVYSKLVTGSESGSLVVTFSGSSEGCGWMGQYSGVTGTPFGTSNLATTASGQTVSPALTGLSPGANDWVIRLYTFGEDTAHAGDTLTNPGGTWTTRFNGVSQVAGNFNGGVVAADKQAGTDSQTITSNVTGAFAVTQIILTAAAGGAAAPTPQPLVVNQAALHRASNY